MGASTHKRLTINIQRRAVAVKGGRSGWRVAQRAQRDEVGRAGAAEIHARPSIRPSLLNAQIVQ